MHRQERRDDVPVSKPTRNRIGGREKDGFECICHPAWSYKLERVEKYTFFFATPFPSVNSLSVFPPLLSDPFFTRQPILYLSIVNPSEKPSL